MTIDEARAVLPELRDCKRDSWTALSHTSGWLVYIREDMFGCMYEINARGINVECDSTRATPENFKAALKLAGVIQ